MEELKKSNMEDDDDNYEEEHSIAIKIQNERDVGIDISIDNKEMKNIISADGKSIILNINRYCYCYGNTKLPPFRICVQPKMIDGVAQPILVEDCVIAVLDSEHKVCNHKFLEGIFDSDTEGEYVVYFGS